MTPMQIMMIIRLARLVSEILKGKEVDEVDLAAAVNESIGTQYGGGSDSGKDISFIVDVLKAIGGKK